MKYLARTLVVGLFLQLYVHCARPTKRSYHTHDYYVIEHDPFAQTSLADVAKVLGIEVVEKAGELPNHWLVRARKSGPLRRGHEPDPVTQAFNDLQKMASLHGSPSTMDPLARAVVSSVKYLSLQTLRQRVKRAPPPIPSPSHSSSQDIAAHFGITDPLFPEQWHLVNNDHTDLMLNVTPLWEMGITGKGIITSLVDDGLDYTSEDLMGNFDEVNSYDFNDHEALPTPKLADDHHGTRCAGQIAAARNNVCGVGIAYQSKVAGVRILSGPISDLDEAAALNYGFQNVSIYSCSWGPPDNGQAMEAPDYLIKKAVLNGINHGRGGRGSIFVFASGNGASYGDQCNFDGYTNSIYSVTVSAVDYKGLHPYYSEPCAANMVVAYSSGSGKHIVTTDKGKSSCSKSHGGTSAAAPNAVGIIALALEVRPDLTWRDIQYLCVKTAKIINPDDPDWENTAAGRPYSYKYGFGVVDASAYVLAARSWDLVKPQAWFQTPAVQLKNGTMLTEGQYAGGHFIEKGGITSIIAVTKEMLVQNNFESLEHLNVRVWIQHTARGDVEVEIVSPNGIRSILASHRRGDRDTSGYPGWVFMSVKHWGENPIGDWTIKVSDQEMPESSNGTFLGWNMMFWGTTIDPSKARQFELPLVDNILPVHVEPPPSATLTSTKILSKPTAHLPGDHGHAPGENTNPAFSSAQPGPSTTRVSIPTAVEGWFPNLDNLVSNQKWFFGAIGIVSIFGTGMALFFWRRRRARFANYSSLPAADEMSMSTLMTGHRNGANSGSLRPTRELYDAFGEVTDDEDDDIENMAVHRNKGSGLNPTFLDGELEESSEAPVLSGRYRDNPDNTSPSARIPSPHGSGDTTESWVHTS